MMFVEIALRVIGATACVVVAVFCGWGTYILFKDGESPGHIIGGFVAFGLTVALLIAGAACAFYNI